MFVFVNSHVVSLSPLQIKVLGGMFEISLNHKQHEASDVPFSSIDSILMEKFNIQVDSFNEIIQDIFQNVVRSTSGNELYKLVLTPDEKNIILYILSCPYLSTGFRIKDFFDSAIQFIQKADTVSILREINEVLREYIRE